jgi:acyl carrier protein
MVASMSGRDRQRFAERGFGIIAPDAGLRALWRLLDDAAAPQVGVLPVDWDIYARTTPEARRFVSRLVSSASGSGADRSQVGPANDDLRTRVKRAPSASRMALLTAHVRDRALHVLGLPASTALDVHQGLRDVGLDSLMAVEIRNVLAADVGESLPATLAFDYPTVAALAHYLASEVMHVHEPVSPQESAQVEPGDPVTDIESLSDEEAARQLAAELDASASNDTHGI